jgi:von Willebrand factor type A domain
LHCTFGLEDEMRFPSALLPVVALLGVPAQIPTPSTPPVPSGKLNPRSVFVKVADATGKTLAGLKPADFEITEGGAKRTVLAAGPATSPMRIVVFADTSDGATNALTHLRTALSSFADAIAPQHELMLVSTGRQMRVRVPPTTDRKKFKDAATALFSDGGATPLVDALLEVDDRFVRKADDRLPVLVIVTGDGAEGSAPANERKFDDWTKTLQARGIAAHAVVLKYKGGGSPEVYANHVAVSAGGVYEYMNTSNALADKLKLISNRIAQDFETVSQKYQVTFESAAVSGPVMVGVAREGVRVDTTQGRLR